jgi:hypothetical protein
MSFRKAMTLTGLTLAVAALTPVSAPAVAGGADRHVAVKGSVSGMDSIDVSRLPIDQTLAIEAHVSGVLSHLGKTTAHLKGDGALTPQGTVAASGASTVVAANGDRLTGTFTLEGPGPSNPPRVHEVMVEITITGGTGRFESASGVLRSTQQVTPLALDGPILHQASEGPVNGRFSY